MSLLTQMLVAAFVITTVMGAVAVKTNFCTMGAVSDAINIGDTGRLRAWIFAAAVAILGVMGLQLAGISDFSVTTSNETAVPPYRTAMFAWPRYILGGLLFGIGMTLGSGCGNKTLLRVGGGNLKSIFVLGAMGFGAYLMMFTNFNSTVFMSWMQPLFVDLTNLGVSDQSVSTILGTVFGQDGVNFEYIVAAVIGLVMVAWAFKSSDFRGSFDNILGGLIVGLAVVAAWYVTTGPMGTALMEEVEFMDERPLSVGAQSLTFVQPSAQVIHYTKQGFESSLLTFAMVAGAGAIFGAFLYSLVMRKFKFEWFTGIKDFSNHIIGGFLMGIGGVLGMGCTIGQGVTGVSTLALGSFITMLSIMLGSALTMKVQLYKMVYESEASLGKALLTGLVDLKLLPGSLRKLEAV